MPLLLSLIISGLAAPNELPAITAPGFSLPALSRATHPIPVAIFTFDRVNWTVACQRGSSTCEVWSGEGATVGTTKMQFQPASKRVVFDVAAGTQYYQVAWVSDRKTVDAVMAQIQAQH